MATTIPPNPTAQTVSSLLSKFSDPDPDFRFMALNDLLTVLSISRPDILHHDYNTAARTVDAVVGALDDQNSEVQNQAIKCIGPLVRKLLPQVIGPLMEKLATLKLKNSVDNAVPAIAMRSVVEALPRPVPGVQPTREVIEAYANINRVLLPRYLNVAASSRGGGRPAAAASDSLLDKSRVLTSDAVDVLIEVVRCFGPMLHPVEIEALQDAFVKLLESDSGTSAVKKRAVVAISMLAHYLPEDLFKAFLQRAASILGRPDASPITRRLYITILGSMARSIPARFGQHLPTLVPFILRALSEDELQAQLDEISEGGGDSGLEFSEVREAALVALEAFLASCPAQMRPFTEDAIASCLRYLKYDPNYSVDEDEDMVAEGDEDDDADAGFEDDDEFEADAGFDDDDDASWKVRRCAAKALYTIISTRSSGGDLLDNGVLYGQVAPALVKRFDEREENVRLEVLSAMSLLVRKTGEGVIPAFSIDDADLADIPSQQQQLAPQSRKRRRQSSGGGASSFALTLSGSGLTSPVLEKIPASGPRADLARLTPTIVKSAVKLLRGTLIPTKQAVLTLLDDIVAVQRGGLADYLDQLIDPILEAIRPPSGSSSAASATALSAGGGGGGASATLSTLRIAALRLTSDIAKNHSSAVVQPHLTKIVDTLVAVVHDRFYKISAEALQSIEEVVKAITPPRSRKTAQKYKGELLKLYEVIVDRATANDADAQVRGRAIHALGTLLSRTLGAEGAALLPEDQRRAGLRYLAQRLKSETTRLAAVRAIDVVAALSSRGVEFEPQWIREVAAELAVQLRKANRALRGSSVQALKHLVLSPAAADGAALDDETVRAVVAGLLPAVGANDAQLLGPGLLVLAKLVLDAPKTVASPQLVSALCQLLRSTVAGSVLDSLLVLVTNVGRVGEGKPLMAALLKDVGVNGDPSVVGKVIGTLLVASGDSAGVTMDSFVQEIKTNLKDQTRASLALAVLGEAGLRLGAEFPLPPAIFLSQFNPDLDKVALSAAVALGRAGAGNVRAYLPVILEQMEKPGSTQYLLLQSVKELLQQTALSATDMGPYADTIWNRLLEASKTEENTAVCAECIGRIVILEPEAYMPKLDSLLKNSSPGLRAIAVQALRYTLPEENEVFDRALRPYLVEMLKAMLDDPEMEIRRHAMSTLNSAAHNKPDLILEHLGQLMPFVLRESVIKRELIREIQMGPFKHVVDDGLEVRKAAYETLYALMETAFSRINIVDLYDRIVEGLRDDNDIRGLCNLMVSKLVFIEPDETARRLDAIAEAFRATLSAKLKETAVKQELEKQDEAKKSVLRVTLLLGDKLKPAALASGSSSLSSSSSSSGGAIAGAHPAWTSYWEWVNKEFAPLLSSLRAESREMAGTAA